MKFYLSPSRCVLITALALPLAGFALDPNNIKSPGVDEKPAAMQKNLHEESGEFRLIRRDDSRSPQILHVGDKTSDGTIAGISPLLVTLKKPDGTLAYKVPEVAPVIAAASFAHNVKLGDSSVNAMAAMLDTAHKSFVVTYGNVLPSAAADKFTYTGKLAVSGVMSPRDFQGGVPPNTQQEFIKYLQNRLNANTTIPPEAKTNAAEILNSLNDVQLAVLLPNKRAKLISLYLGGRLNPTAMSFLKESPEQGILMNFNLKNVSLVDAMETSKSPPPRDPHLQFTLEATHITNQVSSQQADKTLLHIENMVAPVQPGSVVVDG